jgi:CrcB protein
MSKRWARLGRACAESFVVACALGAAGAALRVALAGKAPAPALAFAVAAALGTAPRLWLQALLPRRHLGLFLVNALGAWLYAVFWKYTPLAADTAMVLLAGWCGAFTTFSGVALALATMSLRHAALFFVGLLSVATWAVWRTLGTAVDPLVPAWPWPTLAVNVVGAAVVGFLDHVLTAAAARRALMGGLLGGFTTFSAPAFETHQWWASGNGTGAAAYVATTFVLGVLAAAGGRRAAVQWRRGDA